VLLLFLPVHSEPNPKKEKMILIPKIYRAALECKFDIAEKAGNSLDFGNRINNGSYLTGRLPLQDGLFSPASWSFFSFSYALRIAFTRRWRTTSSSSSSM